MGKGKTVLPGASGEMLKTTAQHNFVVFDTYMHGAEWSLLGLGLLLWVISGHPRSRASNSSQLQLGLIFRCSWLLVIELQFHKGVLNF